MQTHTSHRTLWVSLLAATCLMTWPAGSSAAGSRPVVHGLVNARTISPPPLQEVRYATTYNFLGRVLYATPDVWVHKDVARALQRVQRELAREGLGLKIFDGYRPFSVQCRMWAALPDDRYVSNPKKNRGRHTRGTAVDVTLVDRLGREFAMPTAYDFFGEAAHRSSRAWTPEQRAHSLKLEAVMERHGFVPYPFEWWHFDFRNWEKFPPLDISFRNLALGVKTATPIPDSPNS